MPEARRPGGVVQKMSFRTARMAVVSTLVLARTDCPSRNFHAHHLSRPSRSELTRFWQETIRFDLHRCRRSHAGPANCECVPIVTIGFAAAILIGSLGDSARWSARPLRRARSVEDGARPRIVINVLINRDRADHGSRLLADFQKLRVVLDYCHNLKSWSGDAADARGRAASCRTSEFTREVDISAHWQRDWISVCRHARAVPQARKCVRLRTLRVGR